MDDVINVHRDVVYKMRKRILFANREPLEFKEWFIPRLLQSNPEFDPELHWEKFEKEIGVENWLNVIFQISREVIDVYWMNHLTDMDRLGDGIYLRGYAQKDPKVEYKNEGHAKFEKLIGEIHFTIAERLTKISFDWATEAPKQAPETKPIKNLRESREEYETGVADEARQMRGQAQTSFKVEPVKSGVKKVGRNEPCPCGSGKKYKLCHGKV